LRTSRHQFYERYWSKQGKAIPEGDPTTELRKSLLAQALKEFLRPTGAFQRPARALDAGCGEGEFVGFMQDLGLDAAGIDVSHAAIQEAGRRHPGAALHVGSLEERLPFADGAFDAVWSTEVVEHIFDVHACFSQLNRVLRAGGLFALTTPFHGLIKNLAIAVVGFEKHFDPYVSHIRFFTRKSLTACLKHAGFEPLLWRGIGRTWPLYMSFFVVSRKVSEPGPPPEIRG